MGVTGYFTVIGKSNRIKLTQIYCVYSSSRSIYKMSTKHLSKGSPKPERVQGKLRLYSMAYCPFAQRARLVLLAKGVPHEIVNINLYDKPEWYTEVHPEGKVPALDTGSKVVVESLGIVDYLDQTYPDPPLYPAEPLAQAADKALIEKIGGITNVFGKLFHANEKKTAEEWLKEYAPHLELFEKELDTRGTVFFGGDRPVMVDYILWPWAERAGVIPIILGEQLPLEETQYPKLRMWRKAMRDQPAVAAICSDPIKHHKVVMFKTATVTPDYDAV